MVYNMQTSGKWLQTGGVWLSTQDEAGVSTVVISLPLSTESGLDLASLSYAIKGLIGASELRTALPAEVDDLGISLSWTVGPEWTANAGSMALTLIGSDASGDVVIKWIGNSPVYVVADPIGSNTPAPDVAQQYLAQMQALLDQAGSGGGSGDGGGSSGGGSSGGGEEVYELIDTVTTDENTPLMMTWSQEPDGTPYKFRKLLIRTESPAAEKNISTEMVFKWASLCYCNAATTSATYAVFMVDSFILGDVRTLLAKCAAFAGNNAQSTWYTRGFGTPGNTDIGSGGVPYDGIDQISLRWGSQPPVGTVIKIYGVRA